MSKPNDSDTAITLFTAVVAVSIGCYLVFESAGAAMMGYGLTIMGLYFGRAK